MRAEIYRRERVIKVMAIVECTCMCIFIHVSTHVDVYLKIHISTLGWHAETYRWERVIKVFPAGTAGKASRGPELEYKSATEMHIGDPVKINVQGTAGVGNLRVCGFVCSCVCLSICLSVSVSVSVSQFVGVSAPVCLSVHLSVCLSVCLSASVSVSDSHFGDPVKMIC